MSKSTGRVSRAVRRRLIEQITNGNGGTMELAEEHALPLERLGAWAVEPRTVRALAGLAYLADMRAQMLLSRYRANAAIRLINIATDNEPTELSRKACVDLLKADLKVFNRDAEREIDDALDEAAMIRALEDLGREPGDE